MLVTLYDYQRTVVSLRRSPNPSCFLRDLQLLASCLRSNLLTALSLMTGAIPAQATFADLKRRRDGPSPTFVHSALSPPNNHAQALHHDSTAADLTLYPDIPADLVELRSTPHAGRTLFARKAIQPGSVLTKLQPHVTLLDKASLPVLCSNCRRYATPGQKLLRCSACQATYFCSEASRQCRVQRNYSTSDRCIRRPANARNGNLSCTNGNVRGCKNGGGLRKLRADLKLTKSPQPPFVPSGSCCF